MIDDFRGKYRFLSNFYPAEIELNGKIYPSTEHAFQALKTLNLEEREKIRSAPSASAAKYLGRAVELRTDWESIKLDAMLELVRAKFQYSDLRALLLETGDEELVEGNSWGDVFWGVCRGVGDNNLGLILMKVREEVRA